MTAQPKQQRHHPHPAQTMKINVSQLHQYLNKACLPIYWVAGDEPYLVSKTMTALHTAAKQQKYCEKIRVDVDETFQPDELLVHCHSLSLFSEKQRIEIIINHKIPATLTKVLPELAHDLPDTLLLLIASPRLSPTVQKSKWFNTLNKVMGFVPIWPITPQQLPGWLQQEARERGVSLTTEAYQYLAECTEGNLFASAQTLDTLAYIATPGQPIDLVTLQHYTEDQARFDVYTLVSCLFQHNINKAIHIVHHLRNENTELTQIIWVLSKEFRLIAQLHQALKAMSLSQAFTQFNIWPKRHAEITYALQKISQQHCWQLLQQLAQLDKITKGIIADDPWLLIENIIAKL